MNLNCDAFYKLLVVLAVVLVIKFIYDNMNKSETYCLGPLTYSRQVAANQKPENLIGIVHPSKAGPLHQNVEYSQYSDTNPECPQPYVMIFDQEPFLRYVNKSPRVCQ